MRGFEPGPERTQRPTVDDCPRLSVDMLLHAGALVAGTTTRWAWPGFTATVRAEASRILIAIDEQAEQAVNIVRDARHLGGEQPAFECPGCDRRAWVLHVCERRFTCAKCGGLVYACRHETAWRAQLARSVAALERKGKAR